MKILFFYNTIKDEKALRRAKYIKHQFKKLLNNCLFITFNRKQNILDFFSITRKPKKSYN